MEGNLNQITQVKKELDTDIKMSIKTIEKDIIQKGLKD